jgi:IS6 family transposase
MTERGLTVDHTTVWRWVQRYAPELDRRVRRELKRTGTSWRVDETYVRVAGHWMYLYRALDSCGATLDFYLSPKRDAAAAQQFLSKVLVAANHSHPRVINVDGNPSYPHAVSRLKQEGRLGRRCRCRTSPYLNNVIEQDHRALKRRINAQQGFRSLAEARRTIAGYEVMHMIRKGQVRWVLKGDVGAQVLFINSTIELKSV